MLSVSPVSGIMEPSDRPVALQITFFPKAEVHFKDEPILQCVVTEPHVAALQQQQVSPARDASVDVVSVQSAVAANKDGEIIARIPLRVSGRASFNRWIIINYISLNGAERSIYFIQSSCFHSFLFKFGSNVIYSLAYKTAIPAIHL